MQVKCLKYVYSLIFRDTEKNNFIKGNSWEIFDINYVIKIEVLSKEEGKNGVDKEGWVKIVE